MKHYLHSVCGEFLLGTLPTNSEHYALLQSVKNIYLASPGITIKNIAQQLHITQTRAHQLLKQLNRKPKNGKGILGQIIKETSNQLQISDRQVHCISEGLRRKPNHSIKMGSLSTVEAVVYLRNKSPGATLQDIACKIGVSRQRVHQILKKNNLPTRHCSQKISYECQACGNISAHKFCSVECRTKWYQIPVICTNCGKLFIRRPSLLLRHHSEHLFCSRECKGKWNTEQ